MLETNQIQLIKRLKSQPRLGMADIFDEIQGKLGNIFDLYKKASVDVARESAFSILSQNAQDLYAKLNVLETRNLAVQSGFKTSTNRSAELGFQFDKLAISSGKALNSEKLKTYLVNLNKVFVDQSQSKEKKSEETNQIEKDMILLFNTVLTDSISTSILLKTIIQFFRSNNIIVHKFLLNISILLCVIEEFLKDNNIIDKDKNRNLKRISMFEIVTDSQLDIIAFCDVKKCYPKIRDLFNLDMTNKYSLYRNNLVKNNITEIKPSESKLFSTLSLSTLKFRPPQ
jgi:hypothetical protein